MTKLRSGMLGLTLTSGLALAAASSAAAADVYTPGGLKDQVYVPVQTWTGFYIGGNLGGAFSNNDLGNRNIDLTHIDVIDHDAHLFERNNFQQNAFIGGFQWGYNYQRPGSPIVLGFENDADFAENVDFLVSIRGRIGYAFDPYNAMIYFTGGAAFGRLNEKFRFRNDDFADFAFFDRDRNNETHAGGVVGGGIEWRAGSLGFGSYFGSNVTFGVEGLFYDFQDENRHVDVVCFTCGSGPTIHTFDFSPSASFWTVTARVNYLFQNEYVPLK